MTADILGAALAGHFRCERAIAAARRFITRSIESTDLSRSAVVAFLRKRHRDPLAVDEIERCADEAMKRWLSSSANRYRGRL
jgi:hypothetical protein